jgi:hypothetical protein
MRLGVIKRLTREDLGSAKDVPAWVTPLLESINQFIDPVGTALQGKLSFGDNMFSSVVSQTFTHGVALPMTPPRNFRVVGVLPVAPAANYLVSAWGFQTNSNGTISITLRFQNQSDGSTVTAGTQVKTTVLLIYG